MKIVIRLILAAALLALGVWLWSVLFPGPDAIIRKRLTGVARSASFTANTGALARFANARRLESHFSPDVEIVFEAPGRGQQTISGRVELMQYVMAVLGHATSLQVEFLDPNVDLAADRQSAVVDLTVKANASGEKEFMVQEMKFTLKQTHGDWLITRAETVKTLQ